MPINQSFRNSSKNGKKSKKTKKCTINFQKKRGISLPCVELHNQVFMEKGGEHIWK